MEFDEDNINRIRGPSVDSVSFSKRTGDDERNRYVSTEMEQGDSGDFLSNLESNIEDY
jgi:hypothetical protein